MTTANATEVQNNFGRFLQYAINGEEVVIVKNGKEIARLISNEKAISFLSECMRGVLQSDYDNKEARNERIKRYESMDYTPNEFLNNFNL